jgi:hypothetical protein
LYSNEAAGEKVLAQKVEALNRIARNFDPKANHHTRFPESDPALPYIASMFRESLERADLSLKEGREDYAKSLLRSSVSYCIACHTRHEVGAQFPLLKAFEKPLEQAGWIERMEFMTATRQYDEVLQQVSAQLKAPKVPGISAMDLERGARLALSILVRIKKDPVQAAGLAKDLAASPAAVFSMREEGHIWAREIEAWAATRNQKEENSEDLLKRARKLVATFDSVHPEVRALVASVLLHDYIETRPPQAQAAEALFLLGSSYDRLGEIGLWDLHEAYYRACIDLAPHTETAEKCFGSYQESVTLGFSGSSGVHVPKAVRAHLERLKAKAKRAQSVSVPK